MRSLCGWWDDVCVTCAPHLGCGHWLRRAGPVPWLLPVSLSLHQMGRILPLTACRDAAKIMSDPSMRKYSQISVPSGERSWAGPSCKPLRVALECSHHFSRVRSEVAMSSAPWRPGGARRLRCEPTLSRCRCSGHGRRGARLLSRPEQGARLRPASVQCGKQRPGRPSRRAGLQDFPFPRCWSHSMASASETQARCCAAKDHVHLSTPRAVSVFLRELGLVTLPGLTPSLSAGERQGKVVCVHRETCSFRRAQG